MNPLRVAVTGASGFVGRRLCALLAARGDSVVAVTRSIGSVPGAATTTLITDLADREGLERAFRGAGAVVHLAARVHVMRETARDPLAAFRTVNVEGVRAAHEIAVRAGVRRFLLVSSVKVLGESRPSPYREQDTPDPRDAYGVSKLEAEQLLGTATETETEWQVVRPPLVYGPGVGGNFRRLLTLAARARVIPLPLGGIDNRRSLVFVDNLCDAIAMLIRHPAAGRRLFHVADGEDLSTSDLITHLARAMGGRARLFHVPTLALRTVGALAGHSAEMSRLIETLRVDTSGLRELRWSAPTPVEMALRTTAEWWLARPGLPE